MKFYVLSSDGRKFGPADIPTLNEWIRENRLNRDTELENADSGAKFRARDIAGLDFPAATKGLGGQDPILKSQDPLRQEQEPTPDPSGRVTPYVAGRPSAGPAQDKPAPGTGPAQGQSPYHQPPQPGSPYPRKGYSTEDDGSQKMVTNAWILVAVGFFCIPLIPYPFAIYQANRAKRMGNPNGQAPLIVAWILLSLYLAALLLFGILFLVAMLSVS